VIALKIKEIIQEDFDKMYEYLLEYDYKANVSNNETWNELRHLHKAAYIFFLWKIELNKNDIKYPFLDEIISTMIQIIYISIYRDVKILYMLYRNTIDNFIKISKKYHNIEGNKYTVQIFEDIFSTQFVKENSVLKNSFEGILSLYKTSCGYVHSTDKKFFSLNYSVRNYNNSNTNEFKKCTNDFYSLMKNFNNILIIYNRDIYENLSLNEKRLINWFCNKKDLKKIYKYFYDVNY